jgi:Xaa-Pro aminopeptidase
MDLKTASLKETGGCAPARGFSDAEFHSRLEAAQELMAKSGLDALLLMTEPEVRYFSGFHTLFWQSPTRPWFLIVPSSGKPIAIIPEIGSVLMQTTWIDDIRTWSAPAPDDDGISLLTEALGPVAAGGGTLGVMKGAESRLRMPLGDYERLIADLQGLKVADATGLIRQLRMKKSPAEIKKIAHVCTIACDSFDAANELFHVGQPMIETFRNFRIECLRQGADDVPYLVGGAGQGGYRDVISPPSDRPLQKGDILMLDTGAVFDGYYCDFDRNFALGRADDASRRAYDTLYRATDAALTVAQPGTMCRDVLTAMTGVIGTVDSDVGRMGHGLGMQLTEWPSLAAFEDTVLTEGMVITVEPSITYGDGKLMVHEENIVICGDGPQLLTRRAAPELEVLT